MEKMVKFKVVIEKDEAGYFAAEIPALEGCYTQAKNLKTLKKRIKEVIALCLERKNPVKKEVVIDEVSVPAVTAPRLVNA